MATKKKNPTSTPTPAEASQSEETPVVEAAAPVEEENETASESPPLDEDIIGGMLADESDEEFPVDEPEPPAEVEAEAPEAIAPVEGEPAEGAEAAAEAETTPAVTEEQTPTEAPAVEEPVPPALTLEQQQEARAKWRDDTETALAIGQYALSEDQVAAFDEDPGKFMSKFAARVYLDAVENATAAVVQLLPQVIGNFQQTTTKADEARDSFFKVWDKLDAVKHKDTLQSIGLTYRANNPNATPDEFIRDVGAMSMVALKIPYEEPVAAEVVPTAPAHKPLGPGVGASPAGQQSNNQFTQMAEEFIEDDL